MAQEIALQGKNRRKYISNRIEFWKMNRVKIYKYLKYNIKTGAIMGRRCSYLDGSRCCNLSSHFDATWG